MAGAKSKLPQQAVDLLRLIRRSPDVGQGWRAVSVPLRKNLTTWLRGAEGLYEFDGERVRFTADGEVVMRYF